jgi:hypothetical protein
MCEITHIGMARRLDKDPILGLKLANWTRQIGSEPVDRILSFINDLLVESARCRRFYNWTSVSEIRQAQLDASIDQNDRPIIAWAWMMVGDFNVTAYEEIAACFFPRIPLQRIALA